MLVTTAAARHPRRAFRDCRFSPSRAFAGAAPSFPRSSRSAAPGKRSRFHRARSRRYIRSATACSSSRRHSRSGRWPQLRRCCRHPSRSSNARDAARHGAMPPGPPPHPASGRGARPALAGFRASGAEATTWNRTGRRRAPRRCRDAGQASAGVRSFETVLQVEDGLLDLLELLDFRRGGIRSRPRRRSGLSSMPSADGVSCSPTRAALVRRTRHLRSRGKSRTPAGVLHRGTRRRATCSGRR